MPIPGIAIAGAGFGLNLLSRAGGGAPQLPDWLLNSLRSQAEQDRTSQFVPDEAAFTAQTQSRIDEILAGLPVSQEAFNADLASRGIFSSGEASKNLYSSVYAPIARAATGAAVSGQVGFETIAQRGRIAGANLQQNYYNLLTGAIQPQQTTGQRIASGLGELGDFGTQIGLLMELGLIGD